MIQQHWLNQFLQLGLTFNREQALSVHHQLLSGLSVGCIIWGILARFEHQYRSMLSTNVILATIVVSIMIFIPNFNNETGKNLIIENKEKFIGLMLIFGQLKLLKILMKKFKFNYNELNQIEDQYFN